MQAETPAPQCRIAATKFGPAFVGQTPSSAPDPLVRLFGHAETAGEADRGTAAAQGGCPTGIVAVREDFRGLAVQLHDLRLSLHRSLSANRFEEARQYAARCIELRTPENHAVVISILHRARQIVMVQRSLCAARLDSLRRASEYLRNSGAR